MKKYLFLITTFTYIVIFKVQAQTDSTFTLKQCIEYAYQNSPSVKNSQLDEYISSARVKEIKSTGYPQVNGTAGLVYNPKLKQQILAADNPLFAGGGSMGGAMQGVKLNDGRLILPNFFQLKSAGDASATVTQLLFSGSYIVGLQAAKAYAELSKKSSKQTRIEIVENVTKAYYMVMIGQERMALFNTNLSRLDTLLKQTRALNENGFVEKIDVDRLEVAYNNLLIEKQKGENLLELGKVLLKYQIGMPVEKSLIVKEKISDLPASTITTGNRPEYTNRIEYSLLQSKKELEVLNLKNVKAGYLPTLAAFATGGIFNSHSQFERMFITPWYSYSMVGLNLTLPIFDGFGKYYKGQQAKLEIQKSENTLKNLENTINFQVKQSEINLKNYQISLDAQKRNLELATEIARVTKVKYQEGIGSNLEVITAESSLRESQVNYFNAIYDVLVANIDYQISLGTLPIE